MLRKLIMLLTTMIVTALILSACGSEKEKEPANASEADNKEKVTQAEEEPEEELAEELEEVKEDSEDQADEISSTEVATTVFSELISYMEKETEGTANVMFENAEPQIHTMEDVSVSLDAYTLVELNDFHTDFSIPFNDETDGGVIMAQYTVTNNKDVDVYYMPALYMSFTGAPKDYNNYRDLLPLEGQLPTMLAPENDYLLKAGESVTGYYTYPFGKEDLTTVLDVSTATVAVPEPLLEKGDLSTSFGKAGKFTLSLNEAGAEKVAANAAFYQDRVTAEDMGEKTMLEEADDINKSEAIGDVNVTLDGYQFTEFTPNEVEAPRFENFTNGIVLLTVKFNLDNKGSEAIGLTSTPSRLTVNDGAQYMLEEGMLLDYSYDDLIEAGKSGELLQIYTLDKEQYDKIWKDKAFEIEIGPFKNQDAKDISKGKTANFEL
ncbi:DUF5068 domain-containing protein [Oceanobacillus arenosus]|uniref:DUF5068 domain-containing protein n=1 Tax=Oceanobacillus arenosus TaxID=1229153 RepID=A0A3D8PU61_9BACI|nr:DUF5068 domain-containing protein [Oceanobacillus arenosus]RDW18505.1 DUF5068 domain-containing protein [Oceanobacillus arenosus]